jgi:hypothetical protein
MTAITREYLDALAARRDATPREAALTAALRRVLDALDDLEATGDYNPYPVLRAALAGTQTDDGAVSTDLASGEALPAPSSPDRIDAVANALRAYADSESFSVPVLAERVVAALDAYDRERNADPSRFDLMRARADAAEARLAAVRAIDPADHATSSRDYGRGYAQAIKDVREAMEQ